MIRKRKRGSVAAGAPPESRLKRAGLVLGALLLVAAPLVAESPERSRMAAVVPIHGEINDVLKRSIERRVAKARSEGADTIIFEMDTPGGLVSSALDISKLIKKLPDQGVRTVAWVKDSAFSAGALISVAAQEIVMSSVSSIGDCAPIMFSPVGGLEELGETERAKAESPVLQEFRDSARRNGYDPLLCRAMVSVGTEVWWIENPDTGERRFVDADEKAALVDDADSEEREWRLVKDDRLEQPIDNGKGLLTLTQTEAVALGFAKSIAPNLEAIKNHLGLSTVPAYINISGWEKFAVWLNSPLVRGIVFVIMLIGAYIEFQSPGLILPGATALVALGIFLGAPYAAGLADIWTIVLLVGGLVLLGAEVFVIPGFGIAGISGIALILVALVGTFVPNEPGTAPMSWPTLQSTWDAIKIGIITLSSSTVIAIFGIILMAKYLPQAPLANRVLLSNPDGAALAIDDPAAGAAELGDVGVVVGDLKPAGQARFGQRIVEVTAQGEYVDAGTRVQVIKHEGLSVLVRPLPSNA